MPRIPGADGSLPLSAAEATGAGEMPALVLTPGTSLSPGQEIASPNGRFVLAHQKDGNVVLYDQRQPMWATHTSGRVTENLVMQHDGNLVLYAQDGSALWASGTMQAGSRLALQDDGNAVVYAHSGEPLWASNTWGGASRPRGPGGNLFFGSTYGAQFSQRMVESAVVPVPLVTDADMPVWLTNHRLLEALGIDTGYGRYDGPGVRQALDPIAVRSPRSGEVPDRIGVSTRYRDLRSADKEGAVLGDGAVSKAGEILIRDPRSHIPQLLEIEAKGVKTGLGQAKKSATDPHATGLKDEWQNILETYNSDIMTLNGLPGVSWIAVRDPEQSFRVERGGQQISLNAGIYYRVGDTTRLAHARVFESDPTQLRERIQAMNNQRSIELGRNTKLTPRGFYEVMLREKVEMLAGEYWLRMIQGSNTLDNQGRMEFDLANVLFLDRTHPHFPNSSVCASYGQEGPFVLNRYYLGDLHGLFQKAFGAELDLDRAQADLIARRMFERRMMFELLNHMGFDVPDTKRVLDHSEHEVRALLSTFLELSGTYAPGHVHRMENGTEVGDPAVFDTFSALSKVVELATSGMDEARKVEAMVAALAPIPGVLPRGGAEGSARDLLEKAEPIIERVLKRVPPRAHAAKLAIIKECAESINRPIEGKHSIGQLAQMWIDGKRSGRDVTELRARREAGLRASIRTGPMSPLGVAERIRTADPDPSGRAMELSSFFDNGIKVSEASNGVEDRIRVELAWDPLGAPKEDYVLKYTTGDVEKEASPVPGEGPIAFDIPVRDAPKKFEAWLSRKDQPSVRWTNGGVPIGRGYQPLLGSSLVRAELAVYARRAHQHREGADALRIAVDLGDARPKGPPNAPKKLVRLETPLELRTHQLPLARPAAPKRDRMNSGRPSGVGPLDWIDYARETAIREVDFHRYYGQVSDRIDRALGTAGPGMREHERWSWSVGTKVAAEELDRKLDAAVRALDGDRRALGAFYTEVMTGTDPASGEAKQMNRHDQWILHVDRNWAEHAALEDIEGALHGHVERMRRQAPHELDKATFARRIFTAGEEPLKVYGGNFDVRKDREGVVRLVAEHGRSSPGFMSFGPYEPFPAGPGSAEFVIRAEGLDPNDGRVLTLDVHDAASGRVISARDVSAADVRSGSGEWTRVRVDYDIPNADNKMEFRVIWNGRGKVELASIHTS